MPGSVLLPVQMASARMKLQWQQYLALALLAIAVGGWYIVGRVVLIGRTGPSIMTSNGTLRPPPPPVPKVCSLTA